MEYAQDLRMHQPSGPMDAESGLMQQYAAIVHGVGSLTGHKQYTT